MKMEGLGILRLMKYWIENPSDNAEAFYKEIEVLRRKPKTLSIDASVYHYTKFFVYGFGCIELGINWKTPFDSYILAGRSELRKSQSAIVIELDLILYSGVKFKNNAN